MRALGVICIGLVVAALLAVLPADALAQGCAMCKTALDGPMDPTTEAFNVSSLFLMAMPYTVVGTLGVWMYLSGRRADRTADQDGEIE
jgi:hypothetical protein